MQCFYCIYFPRNLRICAISRLCCVFSESQDCSHMLWNALCNLKIAQDIYMERFCFRQCCDFGVSKAYCIWCKYTTKVHVTEPQNISNLCHYLKESIVQYHQKWNKTTDKWFSTYTKSYVFLDLANFLSNITAVGCSEWFSVVGWSSRWHSNYCTPIVYRESVCTN